ncbi:MAG: cytochrome C oxidase subunit IV family protein [Acidimicrobiales bacterium]
MSNDTIDTAADTASAAAEADHEHIDDKGYVKIFVILAIITAIEVVWSYVNVEAVFIPVLFGMMVVKFFLVTAYFMHLKFDIKLFYILFLFGLILASAVYLIFLSASQIWQTL